MLFDIHTHHFRIQPGRKTCLNIRATTLAEVSASMLEYASEMFLSVGVHPWDASLWDSQTLSGLMPAFSDSRVLMIGEIGLDKASAVPFDLQKSVFEVQAKMAEKLGKPVLLHAVRSMTEVIEVKRMYPGIPEWIIHGFRGGKETLEQYVRQGFYLSFGSRFNEEALLACPVERMFLETDEFTGDLMEVYKQAARTLNCSVPDLEKQIEKNFKAVFDK